MHVLAGPGINSVQDLSGKKVNFSDVGSGTQFSTRLIFELLGIKAEEVNIGQADGYQKVKSGEIAATVLIAGKPTGSFGKFKLEPGMTLLPVPYTEALEQDYLPGQADHEDYPGLIAKGSTRRHRRRRLRARRLQLAARHRPLPPRGHVHRRVLHASSPSSRSRRGTPNGRKPTSTATLRGWKRFPAAEEWLAKNAEQAAAAAPVAIDPAVVRAQAAKAAPNDPAEQERLFQQFMEWAKTQSKR